MELETERAEIQRALDSLSNYQAPICALPEELLSDILQIGHAMQVAEARAFVVDFSPAIELSASQVASYWRNIAIRTPRLWNTIRLPKNSGQIELHLRRSQGLPLDVIINEGTTQPSVQSLCRLLSPLSTITLLSFSRASQLSSSQTGHLSRLRRLIVDGVQCSAASVHDIIRCLNSADTPHLIELELSAPWQVRSIAFDRTYKNRAPQLTAVVLNGVKFADCLDPMEHIKALRLWEYPTSLSTLSRTLNNMVNLVHMQLDLSIAFSDQEPSIALPALLELHLNIPQSEKLPKFLILLDAPNLDCLSIASLAATTLDEACMSSCPSRFPKLHQLIFQENGSFTERSLYCTDYASYAVAFPTIRRLEIAIVVEQFILTILEGVNPANLKSYWPELDTLAIKRCIDISIIASALVHRARNGRPIQRLLLAQDVQGCEALEGATELLPYVDHWPVHWPYEFPITR
ncbi:hypothetical protein HWV62_33847 [Athelia sp. TMB]|nr:hypothetical protein HWV62_33847 [Athelia sp. TMB]